MRNRKKQLEQRMKNLSMNKKKKFNKTQVNIKQDLSKVSEKDERLDNIEPVSSEEFNKMLTTFYSKISG